jgi:gliding motility-associated-like protein
MRRIIRIGFLIFLILISISCRKNRVKSSCCHSPAGTSGFDSGYVVVPNIIAPNGDGGYDYLTPYHQGLQSINFTVFDRKGNSVFNTTQLIGDYWNGEVNGKLKSDMFSYTLTGTSVSGDQIDISGDVCVIANNEFDCVENGNACVFDGWLQENQWGSGYVLHVDYTHAPLLNCE